MSCKYTAIDNSSMAIERHIGQSYRTVLYVSKHLDKIEVLANAATSEAALHAQQTAQNAALALSSSEAAKVSEDNAKASEDISTQNAATTTSDKNTIAGYRNEVELDRVEVATNTATVSADKATVEGYKNDALNAKTEAQRWATGVSGSGVNTPNDSNNAFYYSEVARNNANQTFKSGGYFTPTVGHEYPDITSVEVDTIWLIKFASETGSFLFTTGDLAGETVKNGFMLVYDTPDDTFDYIPTTLSGVNSINGITPDATGNITIDADDVGAAQKTYVDTELNTKVDKVTGKGLSEEDFTTALRDKLDSLNPIDSIVAGSGIIIDDSDPVNPIVSATGGKGVEVNVQTATTYTLVLADAFKMVTMDNADDNTLTVPPNSAVEFPTNTRIDIGQDGAGQTTIVADAGVIIRTPETLKLRKQWSKATLICRDVDVWDIVGDLEAEI